MIRYNRYYVILSSPIYVVYKAQRENPSLTRVYEVSIYTEHKALPAVDPSDYDYLHYGYLTFRLGTFPLNVNERL